MTDLGPAFRRLLQVFQALEIPYMVGGSLASSVHGIPRSTNDVDLVAHITARQIDPLVTTLRPEFYTDPPEAIVEAIGRGRMFNFIHLATTYKFDIYPLSAEPYHQASFARRRMEQCTLQPGELMSFYVSSPEDAILSKLSWYRASNQVLERQWSDVLDMVRVQGEALDLTYLRYWAQHLRVEDLLDKALS